MVFVAIDHGNAAGVVRGLENPVEVVKTAARGGADGILVTPGVLEQIHEELDDLAVVLRIDGAVTTAGPGGPMRLYCDVEQAARLGVDAVVVNATIGAMYEADELQKLGRVASDSRAWGMPVVAEVLSERMMANHLDFSGQGSEMLPADIAADIAMAARVGVELGADFIKTRYCGDADAFRRVVAASAKPILIAGGPLRSSDLVESLQLVDEVMRAGAGGVVFGRQIWQQADPSEALRAVCAIVHEDASVEEALEAAHS